MPTDGARTVMLAAIGIPGAFVAAVALLGAGSTRQFVVALVLAAGSAMFLWLAVGGPRQPVGRASWLATAGLGLAAFGVSLPVWGGEPLWPAVAVHAAFCWFAAALLVVPAGRAVRAVARARRVAAEAPYGRD